MRKFLAKTLLLLCLFAVCAIKAEEFSEVTVPEIADNITPDPGTADFSEVTVPEIREEITPDPLPEPPEPLPDPPIGSELTALTAEYAEIRQLFRDHDNLRWQYDLPGGTARIRQWLQVYRAFQSAAPAFPAPVALTGGERIISYATVPQNDTESDILRKNLNYYRSVGYNGVLLIFSEPADPAAFVSLIRKIREDFGMKVWAAFSPTDNVEHRQSISLPDPDALTAFLTAIAPELDAYLLAYGRTGSHLFLQDPAFLFTVATALRTGKPDLPLLGDHYYGYSSRARKDGYRYWSANLCPSASANLVVNRGTATVDQKVVVRKFRTPCVGVVTGRRTYWISQSRDDWQTANRYKQVIEQRFLRAGAIATMTEHGDGTERSLSLRLRRFLTNDLSKTLYNEF